MHLRMPQSAQHEAHAVPPVGGKALDDVALKQIQGSVATTSGLQTHDAVQGAARRHQGTAQVLPNPIDLSICTPATHDSSSRVRRHAVRSMHGRHTGSTDGL